MDEKAIKELMRKYPDDKLYPLVLQYRELDKIAGTYIGRPAEEEV
jgi:DNA polymerase I-like protein with 3'-5' exonuclease and polymerase domains